MNVRSQGMWRAWEDRRQPQPALITDDGFGPHALHVDVATGCHLWQGSMLYNQPPAHHRMRKVNPRVTAYERAGGMVPPGCWLVPTCGRLRCIAPDHVELRPKTKVPPAPKPRFVPPTPLRRDLAGCLPAERPQQIEEREWVALVAVVAGRTFADVGANLGISRQRVHQLIERGRQKLGA